MSYQISSTRQLLLTLCCILSGGLSYISPCWPQPSAAAQTANCSEKRVQEGCGAWTWPDGSKYVGGFHGGYPRGYGVLYFSDGGRLAGTDNGSGLQDASYTSPDGIVLSGPFQDVGQDLQHPHSPLKFPFWRAFLGDKGTVEIIAIIDTDGRVQNAEVYQSSGFQSFDEAAVAGVKQWRYSPATIAGTPIKAPLLINVQYAAAY